MSKVYGVRINSEFLVVADNEEEALEEARNELDKRLQADATIEELSKDDVGVIIEPQ